MLKFENPQPETQEVTHVVEMETIWNLGIEDGDKDIIEVDITLCYERISQKFYFTKVKMDLEEWTIAATSDEDELQLRVWLHRELGKIYIDERVDSVGVVVRQIVEMLMSFVNYNNIQGVF